MKIRLIKPELNDLHLKTKLLADQKTMSFNHNYGGTIIFDESKYKDWYEKWMNGNNRYYYYVFLDNNFVGEAAYYLDDDIYMISIIIDYNYRHMGIGSEVLKLIINDAKEKGITELYDEIAIDNPSVNMFINNGFEIVEQNKDSIIVKKKI